MERASTLWITWLQHVTKLLTDTNNISQGYLAGCFLHVFAYVSYVSPSLDFMLKPEDFQASRNVLHFAPHANASIGTFDQFGMPHGLNPSPIEDFLVISTVLLYISSGGVQNFRISWGQITIFTLVILLRTVGFFRRCQAQTNSLVFLCFCYYTVDVDSEIAWNPHVWWSSHAFATETSTVGTSLWLRITCWSSRWSPVTLHAAETVQVVERNRWGNAQLEMFEHVNSKAWIVVICRTEIEWLIQVIRFLLGWITAINWCRSLNHEMRWNSPNTDTDSYCVLWGSEDCRYQNWRLWGSKLETPNHLYSFGGTELFAWPLDISSDSAPTSGTWVFPMHLNVNGGSGSTGCLDVRTRLLCFDAARNHFRASPRKMAKKMKRRDIHRRVPQWLFWWWWCQNHWNPWRSLQFCEDGGGNCLRSRNWIIMAKQVHFIASLLEENRFLRCPGFGCMVCITARPSWHCAALFKAATFSVGLPSKSSEQTFACFFLWTEQFHASKLS